MALHPLHGLALCAGVGMLDEGLRAGLEYLGIDYRTAAYVEREAPAAAQLVALMEQGAIDQAPIWSDLVTFDARSWRGKLDCLTAGFPCQPHSVAGKRGGLEDERWIWPDITRIIREAEPWLCWFENVRGLVSTGGLEHVLFDLARLGFDVEWQIVSASEVGAGHERERAFILAWREEHVAYAMRQRRQQIAGSPHGNEAPDERWPAKQNHELAGIGAGLADTSEPGLSHPELGRISGAQELLRRGTTTQLCSPQIFAPGPADESWSGILAAFPHLAPATQPGLRLLADGLAVVVDESRADQLRAVGNGVVPLQAAAAFVLLARRAGIV